MASMTPFDAAIRFVLQAEGVESHDPADPGGLTRYGISQRAHPGVAVATLTAAEAIAIYRTQYWDAYGLDRLPPAIAVATFDGCVQHGGGPAIRMLQHTLGTTMDGILGAVTIGAAYRAEARELVVAYCARRGVYYAHLSTFGRFGLGWLKRLFALAEACRTVAA